SAFIAAVAIASVFGTVKRYGTRPLLPGGPSRMKYARTIELPDGAGVAVAPGPKLGSSVAVGTLGAGVTSGSIEPSDGSGVGCSGGAGPRGAPPAPAAGGGEGA